jgi:hypothetical protein
VTASFSALFVFWLFPVAPPRLAAPGMTDIVVKHNVFNAAHAATSGGFVDIYAALPSLHVGWAVWVALCLYRANPRLRWRLSFWLYPLATTFVVLGTANHYTLDAFAGAAVILATDAMLRLARPVSVKVRIRSLVTVRALSQRLTASGPRQAADEPASPSRARTSVSAGPPRVLTFEPSRPTATEASREKAGAHNK